MRVPLRAHFVREDKRVCRARSAWGDACAGRGRSACSRRAHEHSWSTAAAT